MRQLLALLLVSTALFSLELGKPLPLVTLEGDDGGRLDGSAWESGSLRGKVHILFYVDPDEKELNTPLSEALKTKQFDRSRYASVAIVNMDATWMPDFAIEASLKKKQAAYPDTLYLKDKSRHLVRAWGIADDNSDILLLDREGKPLYLYEGALGDDEIADVISIIEENL
jgi:YtfJ family uncharacterized protein